MNKLDIYTATDLDTPDLLKRPLGEYGYRFLAEGDSWFTIGALNPLRNANLLFGLRFTQIACAFNCAKPGDTLSHMAEMNRDAQFADLMFGRRSREWDGVLLSCGGNDLIDALSAKGPGLTLKLRLLRERAEWGDAAQGAARYLSDEGWQTFSGYVKANLLHMVQMRDRGPSKGVPMFLHGYAVPTPRPAGAELGIGPWLLPSVQAYGIPEDDYGPVAELLIKRLAALLGGCAADAASFPNLHFFDTTAIAVTPAAKGSIGTSGDWVNEIHLTAAGCEKLGVPWAAAIEKVVKARRGEV